MIYGVLSNSGMILTTGLIVSVMAGLLIPVLASWYPMYKVGKVSVIETLKENKATSKAKNKWFGMIGIRLYFQASLLNI